MTELTIGICDDLDEERLNLARIVRAYGKKRELSVRLCMFSSARELFSACAGPCPFQILFLDIFMPDISGMEAAKWLRQHGVTASIIFATTSVDHALEGFDVQAADYLVKPFRAEDVEQALDWCVANPPEPLRCLSVYSEGEVQEFPLSSICYIEVLGHQSLLHTARRVVITRRGLDVLEDEIGSRDFLRCHRSYLVNMSHVQGIEGIDFRMSNGDLVPISVANLPRIRSTFIDWTYRTAWSIV